MKNVKVKTQDLLTKLRTNREKHRDGFLTALEAYRLEAIEVLVEAIEDAKKGKRIMTATHLVEPVDMTREYDRAIAMLEMTVDEVVEITDTEFKNYVMDDWSWSAQVSASNTAYTSKWAS